MKGEKILISGVIIVVVVVLILLLPKSPEIEETIKIGGLFGQTGFVSFAGEASKNGFIMAIEDSGIDVDYVIEDSQSDFTLTVTAANKLIDVDGVSVIIGPEWNEFCELVSPISVEKKILFISPWMTGEGDCLKSEYYFSGTPSERSQIRKMLEYMEGQDVKKIVFVLSNNAWSFGYSDTLKSELDNFDIKIVKEFKFDQDSIDYKTEILKIKEIDPDAILAVIATDNSQGVFIKQLKELQADYQVYISFGRAESDVFLGNFGDVADGVIYPAPKEFRNMEKFREKYEERYGKKPTAISAATTYDMTTLVLDAIKNGAKTTEDVKNYLLNVKDYEGYSNVINFNGLGQVALEEVMIKQINGKNPKILEK